MAFQCISCTIVAAVSASLPGSPGFVLSILPGDGPAVIEKRGRDARSAELLRHEHAVLGRIRHPGVVELAPGGELTEPPVIATFLAGRPLWLVIQRWIMGTVLTALALKMATDAQR